MLLRILFFLILLIFIEVKIASFVYVLLANSLGANAAFFLTWGYFFFTIYLARIILKPTGIHQLSGLKTYLFSGISSNDGIFSPLKRVLAAVLLFIPGYLTDMIGLFVLSPFSNRFAQLLSQLFIKDLLRRSHSEKSGANFFYKTYGGATQSHKKPSGPKDIIDVDYTEVDDYNLKNSSFKQD